MLSQSAISNRAGQVLLKDTLLKADHFPGCQNKTLLPSFEDAPNFRQVPELPIFGVAIPTVAGLRIVLDILEAKTKKVMWHNLREEPLLYIGGHPYVVRDADKPFANLEYTGINRKRVEDMEERLKQDVIAEMHLYNGSVLLSGESDDAEVIEYWEEVAEDAIQTPQDVFYQLVHQEGYHVDYLRVPVTDEKAPKEIDCDLLIQRCWKPGKDTSMVFNCQMGRGRTTTGMIIAALLHLRRQGVFPQGCSSMQKPEWFSRQLSSVVKGNATKQGFYGVVRSLLRILEFGTDAKKVLDVVIDATSHMQNLREAIHKYREQLCHEQNERKRNSLLHVALEYLERYCVLIAFAAYVSNPQFDPESQEHGTFEAFMSHRPEFRSVLQRLLRRNPMSALELHISAGNETQQLVRPKSAELDSPYSPVRGRRGKVLGPHTILKEDHFPGIESDRVKQAIKGAPNFRGVSGLPVYGVGMPTVDGIRNILTSIGAAPNEQQTPTIWFNWREEPLVYINGRPFVLREDKRPFKNLKEYTNIVGHRLEEMEDRLKQDVLNEAAVNHGCILVALETSIGTDGVGMLEDKWEPLDSVDSVQTPESIYAMLQQEGFTVQYRRVPLTDGATPDVMDVDQILQAMGEQVTASSIVFNCQNGVGRTTMGMVVAVLSHFHDMRASLMNPDSSTSVNPPQFQLIPREEESGGSSETEEVSIDETEVDAYGVLWTDGGFLAVRRLTRLLDNGPAAKALADFAIDRCAQLVNIRREIGQFRKGHRRPETSHRHVAYNRGVAYLHRYCFLIAVTAYITGPYRTQNMNFHQWMASRPDISTALETIFHNPTAALSILLPRPKSSSSLEEANAISAKEEQHLLSQRQFPVLNARSILKGGRSVRHDSIFTGIPDIKCVHRKHVYSIGDPSVKTLRKLLEHFRSDPAIPETVIIRDIREELVVYINGFPYTRRDLERPVSSLYHAGVATVDLERMETTLKEDVLREAQLHNGEVLLHQETSLNDDDSKQNSQRADLHHNDITRAVEIRPSVIATKRDVSGGVCTPKEVYTELVKEGYTLHFARVPLSRGRTPQASDLDQLEQRIFSSEDAVHLIIARAPTGTSARYAAAFLSMIQPSVRPFRRSFSLEQPLPNCKFALGEYRTIMHLCRALPNGLHCKATVDEAIDDCVRIGSLREDILSCMYALDTHPQTKQLGLHYLKRYFFLIAFQCYRGLNHGESFEEWVTLRKELCHLLATLKLE